MEHIEKAAMANRLAEPDLRESHNHIPFPDETIHLAEIHKKLGAALREAQEKVEKLDRDYREGKQYMADYRGEIDPHEMFQNELLLKQTDQTGAFLVEVRNQLSRLKESPYFARIDFCEKDSQESVPYYIGKFAFKYENELLIFDWRAPISSMFYDCGIGPAAYDAPSGRVEGQLTKKRQFKIQNGVMEYALESSANVQDSILQRELSHTSDEKMKSIISTIQKEQNQIIRNEKAGTLIIQGVAGSGKTSIALHRIAFLLYRYKRQLSARNVTILSPNKVFSDYISNVIPELGEEPIYELGVAELAEIQLEGVIGFETDKDPLEIKDEAWIQRARYKSTREFVSRMDEYIRQLPESIFEPSDYTFGPFTADREWIRARFGAYHNYPVIKRLAMVAEDIHDLFETNNIMEEEIPRPRAILKSLNAMVTIKNVLALYKEFYRWLGAPELFVLPARKMLEWADVYPFLYLKGAFEGIQRSAVTRHLVIDEMQDYTPVQYAALNQMFPCTKTILGDFGQSINPNYLYTMEDLRALYPEAEFVTLNKSYRSTYEIITFAKKFQQVVSLEPVKRHGEKVALISCQDKEAQLQKLRQAIEIFESEGDGALGIIVKTNQMAEELYKALLPGSRVNLITPESSTFQNGVSVTSIQMAKGLEFDQVVIPDASHKTYCSDTDRRLLYIACTRAMHKLTLLYTGEKTRLIGEEGEERTEG